MYLNTINKAIILVGGYGTRLRPLTLTMPKPLVPFANRPMILHQIEALVSVGVQEIILAVNYEPEKMENEMQKYEELFGIKITFSIEKEPLGTGGPIALARNILGATDLPFFVLNSDVICNYPFKEMIVFHQNHDNEGTILVTAVTEPSKYGVVICREETTLISSFVEKPQTFVSNKINAGIYIFNPSVLKKIPLRKVSIETEIFPQLVEEGKLHAMTLDGFWMDVGQPKDYIAALAPFFKNKEKNEEIKLASISSEVNKRKNTLKKRNEIMKSTLISETAILGHNCVIGPNVVIGDNVTIENGVYLKNCVIMENAIIGRSSYIADAIIGWKSSVGAWTRLEGITVLGKDVTISNEIHLNSVIVLPNKTVETNQIKPTIIM